MSPSSREIRPSTIPGATHKRRARVVQIFPNEASVIRLVGMILTDTNDEWTCDERRYLSEESMALLNNPGHHELTAAVEGSDT